MRPPDDVALYAAAAEQSLLAILASPTLDGLQACLMLVIYRDFSGQLQSVTMLHSIACRCVFALRGHRVVSGKESMEEDTRSRQLFWLCYFFDKHISLRTGQPPALSDDQLDLELPPNYDFHALPKDGRDMLSYSNSDFYPSDLKLTKIKSKISSILYSRKAARKTNSQLIMDITAMDTELEGWRLSVPEELRPCLSIVPDVIHGSMHHQAKMLVIYSHFEYFFLLAAVHRASGRSGTWSDGGALELGALRSSMHVSVEASRSTLLLLKAGLWDIHKESFWLVHYCLFFVSLLKLIQRLFIFYPIWAALTIFCYILYEPSSPNAQADLNLLRLVPRLVRSLPATRLNAANEAQLESLNMFLDELARLSNLVIVKGQKKA